MKKFTAFLSALIALSILFSCSVLAEDIVEEIPNPGADKILVDVDQNTITFIYDETDTELLEQWEALPSFADVPEDFEYQLYISYLTQRGIMSGTSETTFSPDDAITQADFVQTIALAENTNPSQTAAESSAALAASQNVTFLDDPNGIVTHEEAVEILSQLVQYHAQQNIAAIATVDSVLSDAVCQKKVADVLSLTGLVEAESGSVLHAEEALTRAETAQMITGFLFDRDKPTFITGTTPISYLGTEEVVLSSILSETAADDDESFHAVLAGFVPEDGVVSPNWTSHNTTGDGGIGNSVHMMLANQGFYILFSEKGDSVSNIRGKYSQTALANIFSGCVAPDDDETGDGGHFCSPFSDNQGDRLLNTNRSENPTAYTHFNNHYYDAKVAYTLRDWTQAYDELGRAIHYLEDMNCPPHAALITDALHSDKHTEYEVWVRDNFLGSYWESTATASTYSYMCNSTFFTISYNFATLAKDVAQTCVYCHSTEATGKCLRRTQRAIAGLGYRFLVDTGRAN